MWSTTDSMISRNHVIDNTLTELLSTPFTKLCIRVKVKTQESEMAEDIYFQ